MPSRWSGAEQADQGLADGVAQLIQQFISRQTTEELKKSQILFDQFASRIADLEASLEKIGDDDPEKKTSKLRRELREVQQQWEKLSLQRSEWEQQALHYTYCKRSGLYEQGKLLYEKGGLNLDNLTEGAMVNVEEDYQVCVRMLVRAKK